MSAAERNPHCRKCRYRVWAGSEHCCDYIGITGHARQLICRIEDCALWREEKGRAVGDGGPYKGEAGTDNAGGKPPAHTGEAEGRERDASGTPGRPIEGGARKVQRRTPLKDRMWPQVLALYQQGLTNSEICRELGLLGPTVGKWLHDEGYESHGRQQPGKYAALYPMFRTLYEQGLTDSEIARRCGLSHREIIRNWRKQEGLPSHVRKTTARISEVQHQAWALYDKGADDEEIGREVGLSAGTIARWRQNLGLPTQYARWMEKQKKQVPALLEKGLSDQQIADRLGISTTTVAFCRETHWGSGKK